MRNLFIVLAIASLLSACGLKGPLYLPEQKPAAKPPAGAQAAPADEKKSPGAPTP